MNGTQYFGSITDMIRIDHTHVLALFRRNKPYVSCARKQALATSACLALEIHAQLEEEIFYPALRKVAGPDSGLDLTVLDKSVPEHDEMRRLVGVLRQMDPVGREFDATFAELMRKVLHHVADEETVLLPFAETHLQEQLRTLGIEMTRRRMQLLAPHATEVATTSAMAFPVATALLALGTLGIAWRALSGSKRAAL